MLTKEDVQKALNNMFGFIFTQPIHKTLKDMAILQVGLVVFSQVILFSIVASLDTIPDEFKSTAYVAIALALIGQIFAAVFGIKNKD